MFSIGDRVVYPMHGAGVIEAIEDQEILGAMKKYYVMHMPLGGIKVMIPLDNVDKVGLRDVIRKGAVDQVMDILQNSVQEPANSNWNRRYRANMDKIKSGSIFKVAEVARSLLLREVGKGLSSGERRMLDNTRQILASELMMVKDINRDEIMAYLDRLFNHRHNWTEDCVE